MGAYLSSPVTDKVSSDETCTRFTFGASSMQGWRISQEDAHNCIPKLDKDTALFAVYDGHGGSEVAQYCSKFLPDCIKNSDKYEEGKLGPALIDAFLKFDSTLVQEDVIKELKHLAGVDDNDEEDEDEDPVGRGEAEDLRAEADMPLDELLAKYQTPPGAAGTRNLRKKENFRSPIVRPKQNQADTESGPSTSFASSNSGGSDCNSRSRARLTNGLADNENNLNKEKELQESVKPDSVHPADGVGDSNSFSESTSYSSDKVTTGSGDKDDSSVMSVADSLTESGDAEGSGAGSSSVVGSCDSSSAQSSSKSADPSLDKSLSSEDSCAKGEGSSGSKADGSSKSNTNGPKDLEEAMEDDDDDGESEEEEDDEDEWQDISGEEDEEEEEDDEEEEMEETEPVMDMSNEEPGSDSGCTACVALLRGNELVVANAGDSRCVLCRGGKAVDLSIDHKPEDDNERKRIENAGGKVTADGRVNGGLNLSRAIGDHFYKRKEDMTAEQQMITALPDIQTVALSPEDQFVVIACDGIWNSMSSQDCVDFIGERLKDPVKKSKPSLICEELFDHCLAANTYGDGTGCDNMTCIVVVLHNKGQMEAPEGNGLVPSKRCVRDLESAEENSEKRPRVEDEKTDVSKEANTTADQGQ